MDVKFGPGGIVSVVPSERSVTMHVSTSYFQCSITTADPEQLERLAELLHDAAVERRRQIKDNQ